MMVNKSKYSFVFGELVALDIEFCQRRLLADDFFIAGISLNDLAE